MLCVPDEGAPEAPLVGPQIYGTKYFSSDLPTHESIYSILPRKIQIDSAQQISTAGINLDPLTPEFPSQSISRSDPGILLFSRTP